MDDHWNKDWLAGSGVGGRRERTRMASRSFLFSCPPPISLPFYFKCFNCHNCSKVHLYVPIMVTLDVSHYSVELLHLSLEPDDHVYFQFL